MLLPIKAKNPPESLPYATIGLIALNVIVYVATSHFGLIVRDDVVEEWAFKSADFPSLTLLTSLFLHADLFHILGNMWFLYLFGFAVEGRLKSGKFLLLYFAAGFAGGLLHHFLIGIKEPDVPSLGASGAIMGVLGAAIFAFPYSKINMFYWLGFIWYGVAEWAMWVVGLFYLGYDALTTVFGMNGEVATLAHIGGAIAGFVTAMALGMRRDDASASEAKASLADYNDVFALKAYDVKQIAVANPEDADAALAWVWTSMGGGRYPMEESLVNLDRHIPHLVRNGRMKELADVLIEYGGVHGRFHPRYLVDVGLRAEREAEPHLAMRLFEAALANPHLSQNDRETTLFQLAMVHEMWFKNYHAAATLYRQVADQFGGSPLADQAVARYKIVAPLAR